MGTIWTPLEAPPQKQLQSCEGGVGPMHGFVYTNSGEKRLRDSRMIQRLGVVAAGLGQCQTLQIVLPMS